VAACWYGGAVGTRDSALHKALARRTSLPATAPFRLAALGKVDLALSETAATCCAKPRGGSTPSDRDASGSRCAHASRPKAAPAWSSMKWAARSGPRRSAATKNSPSMAADLPVFIRQSHAERDFAALGERSLAREAAPWTL
jgi:hypothetical protein